MPNRSPLVLIVEDEPDLREVITSIVEDAGFLSHTVSNYRDGLVSLNAFQPTLLIVNVLVIGSEASKMAEAARRIGVPTLLISEHSDAMAEAEARGIPFLCLPKKRVASRR